MDNRLNTPWIALHRAAEPSGDRLKDTRDSCGHARMQVPCGVRLRNPRVIMAIRLRACQPNGWSFRTACTTVSSASRARLSARAYSNAACAGSEKSTAQRMREI
jgi:hypothetical protein